MPQYFNVKVQFRTESDNGKVKKETVNYLVDAMSVTEAEARTVQYLLSRDEEAFEVKAASAKILQMKDDLVFLCAQDSLLQRLSIEVSLPDNSLPQLIVRFTSPKELTSYRRAIDSINSNIRRAYDEI
jgi:hypothetical protein